MKKMLMVVLVAFLAMAGAAAAADVEGKIQSLDPAGNQLVLEDGTTLVLTEDTTMTMDGNWVKLDELKEGAKVKASYQEKDGKNVAETVEVSE